MIKIQISDAKQLVDIINNKVSHTAGIEAIMKRDLWIIENDLGLIEMDNEVRAILECALIHN